MTDTELKGIIAFTLPIMLQRAFDMGVQSEEDQNRFIELLKELTDEFLEEEKDEFQN